MLTITDRAAEAIDAVVASAPNAADTAGLRIARATAPDGQEGLALSLTDGPAPDDAVVEGGGAPVFVDAAAAPIVDDKVLDAEVDGDQVGFMLRDQQGDEA
ncbi:MAG: iron-sulfur cluster assembly protein [Solirubrobacteraceae bacterium]|nr:iron-sulfur cluster assembly protein [Solirubrobacteraceae bacterium]